LIEVRNSPRSAGVVVRGDRQDFEALYGSLHKIVGEDGEYRGYQPVRIRVLGVCYDLRHALMGNRALELVDNGMTREHAKNHAIICPPSNVYLAFHVVWPEMLFVLRALHELARIYAQSQSKAYCVFDDSKVVWDEHINQVRGFQIAVVKCLEATMSPHSFRRLMNILQREDLTLDNYTTQYVDELNIKFLDEEERTSKLLLIALRLIDKGKEYQKFTAKIEQAAMIYGTTPDNIQVNVEYPEEIEW